MLNISIITVFPSFYDQFLNTSLIKRAQDNNAIKFNLVSFSDQCPVKVPIDEPTVGHGPGMVIKPTVVESAIEEAEAKHGKAFKIFFSPQGTTLTQPTLRRIYQSMMQSTESMELSGPTPDQHLMLVCARYEGFDRRVEEEYADEIVSIGDYVLMGGDLPAQVFLEAILRLVPEIIGNQNSVLEDSFESAFFDHPTYGLPVMWKDRAIPELLRSGNHKKIQDWNDQQAAEATILNRFDWFREHASSKEEISLGAAQIPNHYVTLLHGEVITKNEHSGVTSITPIDLHDIARSSTTYGVKKFFVVTPLLDQQAIINKFLSFWQSPEGAEYNKTRQESTSKITMSESLADTVKRITEIEGKRPILITTCAKINSHPNSIDYHSQGIVWQQDRPVLLIFGTGQGLAPHILEQSDYLLDPINGMSAYNHLSVRSAVGIILDRWLGLNPINNKNKRVGNHKI